MLLAFLNDSCRLDFRFKQSSNIWHRFRISSLLCEFFTGARMINCQENLLWLFKHFWELIESRWSALLSGLLHGWFLCRVYYIADIVVIRYQLLLAWCYEFLDRFELLFFEFFFRFEFLSLALFGCLKLLGCSFAFGCLGLRWWFSFIPMYYNITCNTIEMIYAVNLNFCGF